MIYTSVRHLKKSVKVEIKNGENLIRKVTLKEGNLYKINPINKQKLKNRDRVFKFLGVNEDGTARAKFVDTGKVGKVAYGEVDNLDEVDLI